MKGQDMKGQNRTDQGMIEHDWTEHDIKGQDRIDQDMIEHDRTCKQGI